MIDVSTIGMVVIFVMAFFIVSWQAERVRKAEAMLKPPVEEPEIYGESADEYAKRVGLKRRN